MSGDDAFANKPNSNIANIKFTKYSFHEIVDLCWFYFNESVRDLFCEGGSSVPGENFSYFFANAW